MIKYLKRYPVPRTHQMSTVIITITSRFHLDKKVGCGKAVSTQMVGLNDTPKDTLFIPSTPPTLLFLRLINLNDPNPFSCLEQFWRLLRGPPPNT